MDRLKNMKHEMIRWVDTEISKGKECANLEDMGEVVDMIKDLAEAEEKCIKAAYYSTIMDAMDGSEDHARRYGYDHWRYSSGRYAPKGHGTYSAGYTPFSGNVHVHDPNMEGRFRMGYPDGSKMRSKSGEYYDDYRDAKRHYHESGSKEDLSFMNQKMGENLSNIIMQLKEMSEDASPEMRSKLKIELAEVMEDLKKMM